MGDPKKKDKKYDKPKRPYDPDTLLDELRLIGLYGLRNKKELWRTKTRLSSIRSMARSLLNMNIDKRTEQEARMVSKLYKMGLVRKGATPEEILTLRTKDLLERRLQTLVWRKDLAKTLYQSRQMITHGHIMIKGQKIKAPSYYVSIDDEQTLDYSPYSPYSDPEHSLRKEMVIEELIVGEEVE